MLPASWLLLRLRSLNFLRFQRILRSFRNPELNKAVPVRLPQWKNFRKIKYYASSNSDFLLILLARIKLRFSKKCKHWTGFLSTDFWIGSLRELYELAQGWRALRSQRVKRSNHQGRGQIIWGRYSHMKGKSPNIQLPTSPSNSQTLVGTTYPLPSHTHEPWNWRFVKVPRV